MRRALLLLSTFSVLVLTGCPKTFKNGECESSDNCKDQAGYGKVCVQGQCKECGLDTDCKAGFVCKANKCEPRPECEGPADCAAGKACQAGKCVVAAPVAECGPDAAGKACGAGQECLSGKCVAASVPPPPPPADPCQDMGAVFFGFNDAALTADSRTVLERNAQCIKGKGVKVTVEGNCDERGTADYNLHLGQRRAEAVKKYLVGLGVPAASVKVVSYGKEKPLCTESNESCWQKNRRADVKAGK